jgi:hypothetical protein
MLSIQVTDTAEQTRRVLVALGDDVLEPVDLEPWIALQEWIETGSADVIVPFARALANAIPHSALAVRLRRDFATLLNLIRSHALLHQASRDRDERGHIVATLTDYAVVRELVADILAQGVEATVPPSVRETVEIVARLRGGGSATLFDKRATAQPLPVSRVAQELGIDKSPASRRVKQAIALGYLRNLEDRKGRPHNITLGDPMPSDVEMLPAPEELELLVRDGREVPDARGATDRPATDASDNHQDNGTTATPMSVGELQTAFNAEDITEDLRALKWIKEWNRHVGVTSPVESWESLVPKSDGPPSPRGQVDEETALLFEAGAFREAGWTSGALEGCVVCGRSAASRDPQGRVRHPGCDVETRSP